MFIDVLLSRALVSQHSPADEILIGDHDAEPAARLGDALHFFEPLPHIQEVLERAQTAHEVEGCVLERQCFPCPDRHFDARRDSFRELNGFIGEIDSHGVDAAILRRGQQGPGAAADV